MFLELIGKMLQGLPDLKKRAKELLAGTWLYRYVHLTSSNMRREGEVLLIMFLEIQ